MFERSVVVVSHRCHHNISQIYNSIFRIIFYQFMISTLGIHFGSEFILLEALQLFPQFFEISSQWYPECFLYGTLWLRVLLKKLCLIWAGYIFNPLLLVYI